VSVASPEDADGDDAPAYLSPKSLSPDMLLHRPPTPLITTLDIPREDESIVVALPCAPNRQRIVRFKSRVRISSGIHDHENLSVSHSSSFSDSSSMSAPLRPAAEQHIRPTASTGRGREYLDETFSSEDSYTWLSPFSTTSRGANPRNGRAAGPPNCLSAKLEPVDESTALLSHRRRRGAVETAGKRPGTKGPPNYIVANGGIPRSPVPSPVTPKAGKYGAMSNGTEDDDDPDSISTTSSKTEDSRVYGVWTAGWSGGWKQTQSWWSKFREVICCGHHEDDYSEFGSPGMHE